MFHYKNEKERFSHMLEKFMNHFHQSMYKSRGAAIREGTAEFSN